MPEYILWDMSFANVGLYNAILPSYGDDENDEKEVSFEDLASELGEF